MGYESLNTDHLVYDIARQVPNYTDHIFGLVLRVALDDSIDQDGGLRSKSAHRPHCSLSFRLCLLSHTGRVQHHDLHIVAADQEAEKARGELSAQDFPFREK
jgi:hypothetical protein